MVFGLGAEYVDVFLGYYCLMVAAGALLSFVGVVVGFKELTQ